MFGIRNTFITSFIASVIIGIFLIQPTISSFNAFVDLSRAAERVRRRNRRLCVPLGSEPGTIAIHLPVDCCAAFCKNHETYIHTAVSTHHMVFTHSIFLSTRARAIPLDSSRSAYRRYIRLPCIISCRSFIITYHLLIATT